MLFINIIARMRRRLRRARVTRELCRVSRVTRRRARVSRVRGVECATCISMLWRGKVVACS